MSFLGVGYQEVLVVLVLMLVVLGPERLPNVAYQIGRAVRTLQQYARAVRSEFSEEITYIEDQYRTVRGEVETTRQSFREEQARFATELRDVSAPIQQSLQELPAIAAAPSNVVSINGRTTPAGDPDLAPEPAAPAAPPAAPSPPLVF